MNTFRNNWPKIIVLLVLFLMCAGLVLIQVEHSESITKLESALLSGFQFLASLAFAWVLSFLMFEIGYKDKQKKFALGAFRRIKEIERNIVRTSDYVNESIKGENDLRSCLEVIKANLVNARHTVSSSIYDWSDIIEDEIEISAQIEKLERDLSDKSSEPNEKAATLEIEKLSHKLPPSLRRVVSESQNDRAELKEAINYLRQQVIKNGHLDLDGFWEADDGFVNNPSKLKVDTVVYIMRGFTNNREGAIMACDSDGNSFGVITNRGLGGYDLFARALDEIFYKQLRPKQFGGTPVEAVLTEIQDYDEESRRTYFKVVIDQSKFEQTWIPVSPHHIPPPQP